MEIDAKLLRKAAPDAVTDDDIQVMVSKLGFILNIRNHVAKVRGDIVSERIRHDKAMAEIEKRLRTIQSQCHHPVTNRSSDPSGGNDSVTSCEICGAEW